MAGNKKNTKKIGDLGEEIAVKYLKSKDFSILETNYLRKWGELDIVAQKCEVVHFIEVKTVSYETRQKLDYAIRSKAWRPEEMVHKKKLHQISKAIQTWLPEHNYKGEFVVDVLAVRIVPEEKYAKINFIKNVLTG